MPVKRMCAMLTTMRQAVKRWFKNSKARVNSGGTLSSENSSSDEDDDGGGGGGDTRARGHVSQDGQAAARVAKRLLLHIKGRASSAPCLWAREHDSVVKGHMATKGIGEWRRAVKELFNELPGEEKAAWCVKAKELKDAYKKNPDQCYE